MKKILLLLTLLISLISYTQDYKEQWTTILQLEADGKYKSAAAAAEEVYRQAKKDKNEAQLLKTFFFRAKFIQALEEDAQTKIIAALKTDKTAMSLASQAVTESLYAKILHDILKQQRYIHRRTDTDTIPEDINLWSYNNFIDEINKAYAKSLTPFDVLYNTSLADYGPIVEPDPALLNINRPLLDFLAERFLEYDSSVNYEYVEREIISPHAKLLFGDTKNFLQFKTTDSLPTKFKSNIKLLQDLEWLYLKNNDSTNLQRAVLRRLENLSSKLPERDFQELYLKTVSDYAEAWGKSPFAYEAKLVQAKLLAELAHKTIQPDYNIKALTICEELTAIIENNSTSAETQRLKHRITNPSLTINTSKYLIPGKPSLAQINYNNVDTIYLEIYKVKMADVHNNTNKRDLAEYLKHKKPTEQKQYILPEVKGHFEGTTEIIIPSLVKGTYVLAFKDGTAPEKNKDAAFIIVQASQILLAQQSLNGNMIYQALDIETGEPVAGAAVYLRNKKTFSDKRGNISIPPLEESGGRHNNLQSITVIHKGDTLSNTFTQYYYFPNNQDNDDITTKVQLYLDRGIYRPGQTMYFKGIVVQEKNGVYSTVNNIYVNVLIEGPEGNELKKMRLKVNEFGSFSGEFTLPRGGLTGEYKISIEEDEEHEKKGQDHEFWDNPYLNFEDGYKSFRVEEYKRPTFEVVFDTNKDDIKVNEKVSFTGSATSFSGAPVAGAKVKYRIKRSLNTWPGSNSSWSGQIIHGETTTTANGKFKIEFIAEPDPQFKKEDWPVFNYTVFADVTDITGETRSSTQDASVGYHSLALILKAPALVNPKKENSLILNSENLNGQQFPVEGEVSIYKVNSSSNILIPRPWKEPEIQSIPKEIFTSHFPHLPYQDYNIEAIHERLMFMAKVNTAKEKKLVLRDLEEWESGKYEAVFTAKDSTGNIVDAKAQFSLIRDEDLLLPDNEIFKYEIVNSNFSKDGYIKISLRSSLPELYINVNVYNGYKGIFKDVITIKNGRATIKIPIGKEVKNKVSVHYDFVWQNHFFEQQHNIDIPVTEEKIEIETTTITNKLLPGSSQTWSFAIRDSNKAPVEILASMYDASLDRFTTEKWETLKWENYHNGHYRYLLTGGLSYGYYYGRVPNIAINGTKDDFYTYGFNIVNSVYTGYKHKRQLPGSRGLKISGIIKTIDQIPIHGVYIVIEGIGEGVETDKSGKYTIYANKGDRLIISGAPYITKVVAAERSGDLNIILMGNPSMLNETVVEGYHQTTKGKAAYAVTTIKIETIEDRANASVLQNLQGQIAGLNIAAAGGQPGADGTIILRGVGTLNGAIEPLFIVDGIPVDEDGFRTINQNDISSVSVLKDAAATSIYGNRGANGVIIINTKKGAKELEALQQIQARKNFNETAFFYPHLLAGKDGSISLNFTTPEALTEWKLRILAHNKNAVSGYFETIIRSQKDLMVVPNMPRYLREKDTITIIAKITNLTNEPKEGNALLQLFDSTTLKPVDAQMLNIENMKPFSVEGKGSTNVSWKIAIPEGLAGVQYKILAKADDFTDGEENILPVLTNNMLVTESIPLWVKPNTTREYTFKNIKENNSPTLRHHGITLEYTSNPAWAALQSLPYLMEYEHDCAEQVFSRYYANAIATYVLNGNPEIAQLFAEWRKNKISSKLVQNEELKTIVMAETPWLLDAQSEEEKKNRIALLFDLDKMQGELYANLQKLYKKQNATGGFPWFDGGEENEFITRHILSGIGHLHKLGVKPFNDEDNEQELIENGLSFIDSRFEVYSTGKHAKTSIQANPHNTLHYLYTRSFYLEDYPVKGSLSAVVKRSVNSLKKEWLQLSLYQKAMASLVMYRYGETETAKKIITHLKESSSSNEEWGMYWIANKPGWYWYNAPIETQALLIEAFTEVTNDIESADAMKVWLLKNKQNKNWPTTKATTEAVYALLMQGSDWLSVKENTTLKLGDKAALDKKIAENDKEAGTGYMKLNWKAEEVTKDMATLTITNNSEVPGYGGFYWQYFEDLDKIKPAQEGLMNVSKELYLNTTGANGALMKKVTPANGLKIGDLITVRLIITVGEDVEYIHLKDMRAAGFEPVDVLSGYEWKDGLGFYRSTRDAVTNFFFDRINKGTYVLEYNLRVNNAGQFSNGITTIQSMYAPEFSGHTKGIRINTQ